MYSNTPSEHLHQHAIPAYLDLSSRGDNLQVRYLMEYDLDTQPDTHSRRN